MRLSRAIDLYLGELARRGRQQTTRESYRRLLYDFADRFDTEATVDQIALEDYEKYLDRWVGKSPSTLASGVSLVKRFSEFLHERGYTPTHVAFPLKRPRRLPADELNVVTITPEDGIRMLNACANEQELLCLAAAAYFGRRRAALAACRRGDVDLERGTARFREKGGKTITQPIPDEFLSLLRSLDEQGFWLSHDEYLIPNRRPNAVKRKERSDKVIWNTVKIVAERARVNAHVHALRAAFATRFLEQHPDHLVSLQNLMGHARAETTLVYLRRLNRQKAMDTVRDLTWGGEAVSGLSPKQVRPIRDSNPCSTNTEAATVRDENSQAASLLTKHLQRIQARLEDGAYDRR